MKQTESLTESVKASNLALLSSSERSSLRETMREMEAKEWINRFQTKRQTQGFGNTKVWWEGVLDDIAKKRGKPAAEDLRQRMNRIKNEIRRPS
tara:strand:- start:2739 stop:3020 length:282 start_codon:yes stop_codon:yes gene_type:complete